MDNNVLLPCKSCGHLLSDSAPSCPHCGDQSPFCFEVETIKKMGETDGRKAKKSKRTINIVGIIAAVLLYCQFRIWWVSIMVFIIAIVFSPFFEDKADDNTDNQFEKDLDSDYESFKNMYHYNLTDEQYMKWKETAYRIYRNEKCMNMKD